MGNLKKIVTALLTVCMLLSVIPAQGVTARQGQAYEVMTEWESEVVERESHSSTITAGPELAQGNHMRWVDRIADLPDFAGRFYKWLEDNAHADGALADPSLGVDYGERKAYLVETVTGSVPFTYREGDSLTDLAYEAALADMGNVPSLIVDYIFTTYAAFDRDHPEVFWLSGSSKCGRNISYSYQNVSGGRATATYTLKVYFYLTADNFDLRAPAYRDTAAIAAGIAQRDADVARIMENYPEDASVYDQIRYFNDALTQTNAYNSAVWNGNYDSASDAAWECTSALSGSVGVDGPVCEGYSRAFKVLCDRVDIPCVLVEGYADGGAHMWNNVQLGSGWYAVDVTWNDPVDINALELKCSGDEWDHWLGMGSDSMTYYGDTFGESHVVDHVITTGGRDYCNGPVLSTSGYEAPMNYLDIAPYRTAEGYTAPTRDGAVFAGWYSDEALTRPISQGQTSGWAYAKFVDATTLTVKFQTTYGTNAASASTDLRLLTSVESLELNKVSFRITIGTTTQTIDSKTAYTQIKAGDQLISDPGSVFGEDAAYFVTYTLLDVPQKMFQTNMTVAPCWKTLDGTWVEGQSRTIQISDTY